jgi:endonuclease YncB( thermonuclease family)
MAERRVLSLLALWYGLSKGSQGMKSIFYALLAGGLGASVTYYGTPEPPASVVIAGEPHGKAAALVSVEDGDTLIVSMDGHRMAVRLDGMDAPEPDQASGGAAADALTALVKNRPLKIVFTGRDTDGVVLTRIQARGADVSEQMLRGGWGWYRADRDKDIDCAPLADAEAEAQLYRRGLWVEQIPVRPWEWRKTGGAARVLARSVSRAGSLQR